MSAEELPSCWICFEESGEDNDKLVRGCSCRGSSGYVHLNCLVKYASEKSRKVTHPDDHDEDFTTAWRSCPNCNQSYTGELQVDLIDKCLEFVEKEFPDSQWRLLLALLLKSAMLKGRDSIDISYKMISLIDEMKSNNTLPDSLKIVDAMTNDRLGMEVDNIKEAIRFLEKARDIYTDIGHGGGAESAQMRINQIKKFNGDDEEEDQSSFPVGSRVIIQNLVKGAKYNGLHGIVKSKIDTTTLRQNVFIIDEEKTIAIKPINMEVCDNELSELMYWKEMYEMNSASGDTNGILYSGERLYQALMSQKGKGLEARRLMFNLVKQSRRTHGDEHERTKELESHLVKMVGAKHPEFGMQMFEVVRYESNMEKVILKGPVLDENARDDEFEETLTFNADEIYCGLNCPVICHGLEDAADTKGKMGQIMSWDKETDLYKIKFEDESVIEVKRGHTRVALDLDAHE